MPKYDWGDGKGAIHSISKAQRDANAKAKRTPLKPPPGSYDPTLDAQERASGRGLEDLIDDTEQGRERGFNDYRLGLDAIGTQRTRNTQDYDSGVASINTSTGRSLADLLTSRTRGGEDYQSQLSDLNRGYGQLATAQGEAQRKAGVSAGGAVAQAARKRADNLAHDRSPIDTAYGRFTQDSALSEGRLGEDRSTALSDLLRSYNRGGEDLDTQAGALNLNYTRGDTDLTTGQTRAEREASEFKLDTADARQFQYGGPVITAKAPTLPVPKAPAAKKPANTLSAGAGIPGTKKRRKGRTVTYGASVAGP